MYQISQVALELDDVLFLFQLAHAAALVARRRCRHLLAYLDACWRRGAVGGHCFGRGERNVHGPLSQEGAMVGRHVAQIVHDDEHLDHGVVRVEESLKASERTQIDESSKSNQIRVRMAVLTTWMVPLLGTL